MLPQGDSDHETAGMPRWLSRTTHDRFQRLRPARIAVFHHLRRNQGGAAPVLPRVFASN